MFNRSQIMTAAWTRYRRWHNQRVSMYGAYAFDRSIFKWFLQLAWQAARDAQLTPAQLREQHIRQQIDGLRFKPFSVDIEAERRRLVASLETLAA